MDGQSYDPGMLREWRARASISATRVAELAGCTRMTLYRAERGIAASHDLLERLAAVYGQQVGELLKADAGAGTMPDGWGTVRLRHARSRSATHDHPEPTPAR